MPKHDFKISNVAKRLFGAVVVSVAILGSIEVLAALGVPYAIFWVCLPGIAFSLIYEWSKIKRDKDL
ncbi:hypothetical protein [Tamilnaduibacter salinus]|uniref:hypothetical protein n=1 Tax=Tamilnaduibacter salinus TaxID=1484056 RepID=UPI000E32855D|nr:hypothetical protein [Tamilnaduibacter salinus]